MKAASSDFRWSGFDPRMRSYLNSPFYDIHSLAMSAHEPFVEVPLGCRLERVETP